MYKCEDCNEAMERNTFVCNGCERGRRSGKQSHNTHLVRYQHCREINLDEGSAENEGSQYWDHAQRHNPVDESGDVIEHDQANPDFVSKDRIDYLEAMKAPSIDMFRAMENLPEAAQLLSKQEKQAVRAYMEKLSSRQTAKKYGMTRMTANRRLQSAIKKLKTFYKDAAGEDDANVPSE